MPRRECCRGRRRNSRCVRQVPDTSVYKPKGVPMADLEVVEVRIEEMEAVRLADLELHDMTSASEAMDVSRRTFTRDLKEGRRKIADALSKGKAIIISGGDYRIISKEEERSE